MSDKYFVGILPNYKFRFSFVDITNISRVLIGLHEIQEPMSQLFSKTILGASFIGNMLGDGQRISLQWKDEFKRSVLVYSTNKILVKGVAYPESHPIPQDLRNELLGQGIFKVIRWEPDGEFYQSFTNLIPDTFEENLSAYILESEQTKTVFRMFVYPYEDYLVSLGVMFQALPEATDQEVEGFIKRIQSLDINHNYINIYELKDEIGRILEDDFNVLGEGVPSITCDCSRNRISDVIVSLGEREAMSIVEDIGFIEISCEFCRNKYHYTVQQTKSLFDKIRNKDHL